MDEDQKRLWTVLMLCMGFTVLVVTFYNYIVVRPQITRDNLRIAALLSVTKEQQASLIAIASRTDDNTKRIDEATEQISENAMATDSLTNTVNNNAMVANENSGAW